MYGQYVVFEKPVVYELVSYAPTTQTTAVEVTLPVEVEEPIVAPVVEELGAVDVIAIAQKYLGCPYVWGGTTSEGFDCSGFVQKVYKESGYALARTAQSQSYDGIEVDENSLVPGDLLCFGSSRYNIYHIGIYIGGGQFIHSSDPDGVVVSNLDGYCLKLVSIRRIVNDA